MVSFTRRPLNPEGTTPGTHWGGGWVGLRTYLEGKKNKKNLLFQSGIETRTVRRLAVG